MQKPPPPRNPKLALTRLLGLVLAMALFWAAAEWGWPGAGFMTALLGVAAVASFLDVLRAHHAWKTRNEILAKAEAPSERFTTRRDAGRSHPDGWE